MRSFNLKRAFPNMEAHPYDWRVDKYEKNRRVLCSVTTWTSKGGLHASMRGMMLLAPQGVVHDAHHCHAHWTIEFRGLHIQGHRQGPLTQLPVQRDAQF